MNAKTSPIDQSPEQILARRAQALAQVRQKDADGGQVLELISFPLGNERYAIPIDMVLEIQPLKSWASVPCTPDFVIGAVNLRGRIYSLMDVARFLGLRPRSLSDSAHILLVHGENPHLDPTRIELCLLADALPQDERVHLSNLDTASSTLSSHTQEYIQGVTRDMLIVLDLKRLLASADIIVSEEI